MARVVLEGLRKAFGETIAVRDMNVTVADGEFVTFLGPSGCGKTTSLRMIAGFIAADAGRVTIGERVVFDKSGGVQVPPERRGLGMVFQSYAVWPHMTVFDNVVYPLKLRKVGGAERRRQVMEALELVKMPELAERYPHQLSGGQQQRVALARALVMDPEVLLLDEPLSNLDAKLREEMRLEIKELQRQTGVTIIFVTHDQLEAMVLSDRVVVLNDGDVQQIGSPRAIYEDPVNRFVAEFIGAANFIPCRRRAETGVLVLEHAPEHELSLLSAAVVPGEAPVLMVRPEHVRLARENAPPTGVVLRRMFMGDSLEYILALGEQTIRARGSTSEEFEAGERVRLTFDQVHFFS